MTNVIVSLFIKPDILHATALLVKGMHPAIQSTIFLKVLHQGQGACVQGVG